MTNVSGTYTMLDAARRSKARRTVFLSTVEIYGENRGSEKFRESDLGYIDCNTLRAGYPESKRTGEALCQAFRAQDGLDVVIPRLPRVYGPTLRPTDTKALSQFLFKAVAGEDIVLKSTGTQFSSYCHVADAVSAILVCLISGESGQAYNVADPSCDIRLRDLAQLVADAAGRQVVFDLPSATEQRGYSTATMAVMDGSRLSRLGWSPLYDIAGGVRRTLDVLTGA
jgi:nucleoside-diphosphate-sugar epimerase